MRLLRVGTTEAGRQGSRARYPLLIIEPDEVFGPMEILRLLRGSILRERGVLLGASSPGAYVRVVVTDLEEAQRLLEDNPQLAPFRRLFASARRP